SMVRAYATIAARGMRCDPIIISEITDVYGTVYPTPSANCEQVIPKTLADSVAHLFKQSYSGTSAPAKVSGIEMAGKTGTVSKNKAIWQVSTNPSLTVAAVISYDSNPQFRDFYKGRKNNYLGGVKVHGRRLEPNSGRETGGLLVKPVFTKAMETRTKAKFHAPDQGILRGDYQGVPSCTGQSVAGCKKVLESAGLRWYEEKVDSDIPKGGVVGLSPSDKAPKGSGISILVSNGPPPPPPTPTPPPFPTPTPFPSNPSP
ncbi:MAG: penicillin-binding transpeptidase domain-containing protein, partial [Propionibacteriaceae bacterium]|nr:penicillin-binding transpeptidase domain-containing protein [Propionibacteriaceae bacterium]